MRLICVDRGIELQLDEGIPVILVLEEVDVFRTVVDEIWKLCCGKESIFVLSDGSRFLKAEKSMEMVLNPFLIEMNSKKVLSKLYAELAETLMEENYTLNAINTQVVGMIEKSILTASYTGLDYRLELDAEGLLKLYDVKIDNDMQNLAERVVEYVKVCKKLLGLSAIVFVDLQNYLTEMELQYVSEIVQYMDIELLLVEGQDKRLREKMSCRTYIIDRDNCVITM